LVVSEFVIRSDTRTLPDPDPAMPVRSFTVNE